MDGLEEKYPRVPSRTFLSFLLHVDAQLADWAERPEDHGLDPGTILRITHTSSTGPSSFLPITGHH